MVNIDNPISYKNCCIKSYSLRVCMPPKGTVVLNRIEQIEAVKMLNNNTYFKAKDVELMKANNPQMFMVLQQLVNQGRAEVVTDANPFVVCGTKGELWVLSANELASNYTFTNNGDHLPINQQTLSKRMKNGYLNWTAISIAKRITLCKYMACFVPVAQKLQIMTARGTVQNVNDKGLSHGKGDFIVCPKLVNGKPDLNNRWVVNGEVFAQTYNNQGWTDCIDAREINRLPSFYDKLPNLIPIVNPVVFDKIKSFILDVIKNEVNEKGYLKDFNFNIKEEKDCYKIKVSHKHSNNEDNFYITWDTNGISIEYGGHSRGGFSNKKEYSAEEIRNSVVEKFNKFMTEFLDTIDFKLNRLKRLHEVAKMPVNKVAEGTYSLPRSCQYGTHEYWMSLDSEEKQKERFDPNSPYYMG